MKRCWWHRRSKASCGYRASDQRTGSAAQSGRHCSRGTLPHLDQHVAALSTYLDSSGQALRCACLEVGLVDASVLPALACLLGDAGTPVVHGRVFGLSALPDAPLGLDDPGHRSLACLLDHHPVRMVEADSTTRLEVIDAEPCVGVALFGRTEAGEAHYVRCRVKKLRELTLEVVIRRHVIKHRPLRQQRREVASPTERVGDRELEVSVGKCEGELFDRQFSDLAGQIPGDTLL